MLLEKVIAKANNNNKQPQALAIKVVLKFSNKPTAKAISKKVEIPANKGITELGNNGFSVLVYATKFSQLPQAECALSHKPNLSATADNKPALSERRKNHSTIFISDIFIIVY